MLTVNRVPSFVNVLVIGLAMSACSLLEATTDTTVQVVNGVTNAISDLSSSTTPSDSGETAHQRVKKLHMFARFNVENLQQDIARGHGEYLSSLEILLDIPPERHPAFATFAQSQYVQYFGTNGITHEQFMEMAQFGSEEMRLALREYGEDVAQSKRKA